MAIFAFDAKVLVLIIVLGFFVFTTIGGWQILGLARAANGGPTWPVTVVAAELLLVSVSCLIVAAVLAWDGWWYKTHAIQVEGRIVGYEPFRGSNLPRVEYEYKGQKYRTESRWGQQSRPQLGQTALVLIDPSDPGFARFDSFGSLWGVPLVFLAVGIMFLIGDGCLWAYRGRLRRHRRTTPAAMPAL